MVAVAELVVRRTQQALLGKDKLKETIERAYTMGCGSVKRLPHDPGISATVTDEKDVVELKCTAILITTMTCHLILRALFLPKPAPPDPARDVPAIMNGS